MQQLPVLELKNVCFAYSSQKHKVLSNVSLTVFSGDRIGIIGGNGSGKSTISKLILGILSPQEGTISLLGKPVKWIHHFPDLGYVGDPGHNAEELGLPTNLKVSSVLRTIHKIERHNEQESGRLSKLIGSLGIENLLDRNVKNLSTGERKRLMVCLTFMRNPKVIIMDEPLDGLDEPIKDFIKTLIMQTLERRDVTVFYIAHDRVEIDSFTDSVFRLNEGTLFPEAQKHFEVHLQRNGDFELHQEKMGQVIGRLTNLMLAADAGAGFNIKVNPVSR